MIIEFEKDYLKQLYVEGKAGKKHRFQPQVIKKYKNTIDKLRAASRIEDLFQLNSLNYEVLQGTDGKQSVRVDQKYRIEFYTQTTGEEPNIITICSIDELSNHYS